MVQLFRFITGYVRLEAQGGLPERLIDDARELLSQEDIRFEDVIANAEYHRQIAEREREMAEETRKASAMNHLRWEELSNRYQYYTDYDNDIRYLKYFVETRRDFLNEVWLEDVIYHRLEYRVDGDVYKVDYVKDGETPKREPSAYKNGSIFAGWVISGTGVPFDEYKPIYEDMVFEALWQEVQSGLA